MAQRSLRAGLEWCGVLQTLIGTVGGRGAAPACHSNPRERVTMRVAILAVIVSLAGCTVSTYEPAPRPAATTYVTPAPVYAPATTTVVRTP